jgi:hypothetical protein
MRSSGALACDRAPIVSPISRLSGFERFQVLAERSRNDSYLTCEVVFGTYRIVYPRKPDLVEIVTVFRGSREFPKIDA